MVKPVPGFASSDSDAWQGNFREILYYSARSAAVIL
jgi:hypothetical protein